MKFKLLWHVKISRTGKTAFAMNNDRNKCMNVGADDYIAKPTSEINLLQMIKKHINE
jgi:CheY-like chemotaxis protein